jgi:predicted ATPase
MPFLDDLQWCEKPALAVVESLLCDEVGLNCLFFVGTYRSNEVAEDHEIFCLAQKLMSFGVPTTMLSLEGLNPKDLNTMVSDDICVFPCISEPLSDIIFQKTKGNPFLVLAFMWSLVDRGLLEYSVNTRRGVWDEDDVGSMDVTGNILYLLSSKMTEQSTNIQSALKVAACFGIHIKESDVATLGTEHSDIHDKLEQVVKEGFMIKVGTSDFKFVHDKIKHGIDKLDDESPEWRINISKLYELAGMHAAANSDHAASRSHLTYASALLPTDHWKSHNDFSLQFSLRLAKSCYSCGDLEKAQCILQGIMVQFHSQEDKLPSYALFARIHLDRKCFMEAYTLCQKNLTELP